MHTPQHLHHNSSLRLMLPPRAKYPRRAFRVLHDDVRCHFSSSHHGYTDTRTHSHAFTSTRQHAMHTPYTCAPVLTHVIGAFAERMKFKTFFFFTILWELLIYYPVAHWIWGDGWMGKLGVLVCTYMHTTHIHTRTYSLRFFPSLLVQSILSFCPSPYIPLTTISSTSLFLPLCRTLQGV